MCVWGGGGGGILSFTQSPPPHLTMCDTRSMIPALPPVIYFANDPLSSWADLLYFVP